MKLYRIKTCLLALLLLPVTRLSAQCSQSNSPTFQLSTNAVTISLAGNCGVQINILNATTAPIAGGPVSYTIIAPGQPTVAPPPFPSPTPFVAPVPGIYTVMVMDNINGCIASQTLQILPPPAVSILCSNTLVCSNAAVTLSAQGADTYKWSTESTNTTVVVNPTTSLTYSVTGSATNACQGTASQSVTVIPLPSLTLSASHTTACLNELVTLTVSGASSYSWSTGQTFSVVAITSTASSYCSVTGFDEYGCKATRQQLINVAPCTHIENFTQGILVTKIFPLPADQMAELHLTSTQPLAEPFTVRVYDSMGRPVKEERLEPETEIIRINTADIPNGLYFFRLRSAGSIIDSQRLIVLH